jgi:hypothetical protein
MPRTVNPDRQPHPKDPKGLSISVRFTTEQFHRVREMAEADQRSMNFVVNLLVEEGFNAIDKREKDKRRRGVARGAA